MRIGQREAVVVFVAMLGFVTTMIACNPAAKADPSHVGPRFIRQYYQPYGSGDLEVLKDTTTGGCYKLYWEKNRYDVRIPVVLGTGC